MSTTAERGLRERKKAAEEFYRHIGDFDPQWVAQGRLVRSQPALLAAQVQTFAALERELSAEVAARSPAVDAAGVRARLTAATFLVAMRVSVNIWLDSPPGTRLPDLVQEALAEAGRGFA